MDLGRKSIVDWAEAAPEDGSADFTPAEEKFVVEAPIGKGGMGEVFLVTDQDLRRQVAMKIARRDMGGGRDARLHFIAEAGAFPTAESVYGMGDASGGVWDWTDSWYDDRESSRVLRGGSWYVLPTILRSALRSTAAPAVRNGNDGFRLARGL